MAGDSGSEQPCGKSKDAQQLAMLQLDELLRTRFGAKTMEEYLAASPRNNAPPSTPPNLKRSSSSSSISPSASLSLSPLKLERTNSSDGKNAHKSELYPRTGKQKDRLRPLRLSRHRSYVAQLNEVCQRMAWPSPEWDEQSRYGRTGISEHSTIVYLRDEHRAIVAQSFEAANQSQPTKAAAREQAARDALEDILAYE